MDSSIIESAELYVVSYLKHNLPTGTIYHSISHTQDVVDAVKTLTKEEQISDEDSECVLIAAWFHDVGYTRGGENHEEASINEVIPFLKDHNFPQEKIEKVVNCILATKMPQEPKNDIERIICDADLFHVATTSFETDSKLLRAEWELLEGKTMTDVEWYQCNSEFLRAHKFYTDFAFRNWSAMKASNLAANEKKLKNAIQKEDEALLKREKKKAKSVEKENKPSTKADKTIETMYRVTLRNHIKLSDIADAKANILLSVNAIILSLALSNLFPKLDKADNHYLIVPTLIFLLTAVTSMIFAIISTRPKVTSGTFTQEDIDNKKVNLLFFGNFYKMPLEVFDKGIFTLMDDREYLYKSLNKDLYFLGIVLARKYRLLRVTYTIFMVGIIASVIAFGIAFYNLELGI
ncbi:Pycsar system effector family protein [Wenyingzhuangia aestuarii]|uniref:Pycsar system effector family protein n=1 Tax=Wenyingzhuangia aestuarii TaxID=1647582 RepID=UPI00143B29C9|nr:Pycsar system effector family protein [Wenyingzhuangia aestuarii]NJB83054.1 putative metal-dependent HD superfamily phosphohydrolase [Wenyingzhuangia aestuarii]